MTDIALIPGPDGTTADFGLVGGDLATDDGLDTAIIISLLTDRAAQSADGINTGGWWGDAYADPLPDGSPDLIGSDLYLYRRALATRQTQLAIEAAVADALAWMIQDNVAASVDVASSFVGTTGLAITITIAQRTAGRTAQRSFNALWNTALGSLAL